MSDFRDALLSAAEMARARAYAPYSGFHVGAALEVEHGHLVAGCNVENASFGLTICAERAAIASAIASGYRVYRRIVIVTDADEPVAPCGACRQVLMEFAPDLIVESHGKTGMISWTLSDLLPAAFRADVLP